MTPDVVRQQLRAQAEQINTLLADMAKTIERGTRAKVWSGRQQAVLAVLEQDVEEHRNTMLHIGARILDLDPRPEQ